LYSGHHKDSLQRLKLSASKTAALLGSEPNRKNMTAITLPKKSRPGLRKNSGGQIAELGPALFIICILIFIPVMDLVYMAGAYASGWYLNQIEAREFASTLPDVANNPLGTNPPPNWPPGTNVTALVNGAAIQPYIDVNTKLSVWTASGIAIFCAGNQQNIWVYYDGVNNPTPPPAQICDFSITTCDISVKPFIPVPWFTQVFPGGVPGLSVNWVNRYSSRSTQEEKGLN
jgi:hypothetical protein